MNPERLTGFVYPVEEERRPRARPLAAVGEPAVRARVRQGRPAGVRRQGPPEAELPEDHQGGRGAGKKAAERLLETWIAELESHRTIDPDRLQLSELLDRWLGPPAARCASPATTPTGASGASTSTLPSARSSPASSRARSSRLYAAKMRGSRSSKPLLAETTVAHHHAMLKTAYNWALEEELLLVNPALRVKNPPALRPRRARWGMGEIASTVIKARGLQVHAAGVSRASPACAWGRSCRTALVRPRSHARFVTHVCAHRRGGRRRHAARVLAEERQGADGAAAGRRLRRAARLARRAEGVPPGPGTGVERGRPRRSQEGRQPDRRPPP